MHALRVGGGGMVDVLGKERVLGNKNWVLPSSVHITVPNWMLRS